MKLLQTKSSTILAMLATLCITACTDSAIYRYATGAAWGTTYNIKYLSDQDLTDSIVYQIQLVNMSLSPFESQSLISAINSGQSVPVDPMLREVIDLSQRVCSISGGYFDPTVAPLVNLWGFGYRNGAKDTPKQEQIDAALQSVGILECSIDSCGYVVRKSPNTEFNFSAIAKGYGVDCIAAMLRRNGCNDYMVEVGGEISLSGSSPSGEDWRIQIDAPIVDTGDVSHHQLKILQLTDRGIATSGNYRNHRVTTKGDVGHTISPITGYPVSKTTLSATVIARTTALADALATSIMAMPDSAVMPMLSTIDDVDALIVKGKADGSYEIITTDGFNSYIKD